MKISLNMERDIQKMLSKLEGVKEDMTKEGTKIITVLVDKLMAEAIERAPVDEGFLEKSFKKEIVKAAMLSQVEGSVFIPANAPASDYALMMHEDTYKLGKKSKKKDAAVKADVGRKYLERALSENERAYGLYIFKKLKELLDD